MHNFKLKGGMNTKRSSGMDDEWDFLNESHGTLGIDVDKHTNLTGVADVSPIGTPHLKTVPDEVIDLIKGGPNSTKVANTGEDKLVIETSSELNRLFQQMNNLAEAVSIHNPLLEVRQISMKIDKENKRFVKRYATLVESVIAKNNGEFDYSLTEGVVMGHIKKILRWIRDMVKKIIRHAKVLMAKYNKTSVMLKKYKDKKVSSSMREIKVTSTHANIAGECLKPNQLDWIDSEAVLKEIELMLANPDRIASLVADKKDLMAHIKNVMTRANAGVAVLSHKYDVGKDNSGPDVEKVKTVIYAHMENYDFLEKMVEGYNDVMNNIDTLLRGIEFDVDTGRAENAESKCEYLKTFTTYVSTSMPLVMDMINNSMKGALSVIIEWHG